MTSVTESLSNHDSSGHVAPETKERQFHMSVLLLLGSDVVFVAALVFAYLYLRELNVDHMWRPAYVHPVGLVSQGAVALLMIVSLACYQSGRAAMRRGSQSGLVAGIALALVFVAAELAWQLHQMAVVQFGPQSGAYASSYFALAGYHVFHLVLLLLLGAAILNRARLGRFNGARGIEVTNVGYLWTWVTIMAIIMVVLPN